jgi:arylsulfatase A-like enzyme
MNLQFNKIVFFLFFGLLCVFGSAVEKPNIIFIMVDDLGYGDLGCYGQEKIKTPNLDKMAKEGLLFTDFYAGNAVCAPSRCSLVTGKHPGNAAVRGNFEVGQWNSFLGQLPIPENETTIFDIVKRAGYTTATYGKWGLGRAESSGDPNKNGVDDFFGYNCQRQAHSYYPRYLEGNRGEKLWLEGNNRQEGGKQYAHDLISEKALDFIRKDKDQPFFLYLPYTLPHAPLSVPDLGDYKNKNWTENQKKQAAMVALIDRDVERVLSLLKELEIDENTIVFFTSDNGAKNDSGTLAFFKASGVLRGHKGDLYEGGIRVPMIVRWPGKIKARTTSDYIGAFWDIMPTFADLAGLDISTENTDGISFLPELLGEKQLIHESLYWEYFSTDYNWTPDLETLRNQLKSQALRMGKWKAVRHNTHQKFLDVPIKFSPLELYNLDEDISETNNVADQHPEIVLKMLELMKTSHSPSENFNFQIK